MFGPLCHLEFIFVYNMREGFNFILFYGKSLPQHHLLDCPSFSWLHVKQLWSYPKLLTVYWNHLRTLSLQLPLSSTKSFFFSTPTGLFLTAFNILKYFASEKKALLNPPLLLHFNTIFLHFLLRGFCACCLHFLPNCLTKTPIKI